MDNKYDIYRAAQDNGGPCPICNWRDGDGVRTCFYDSEFGIVSHQNSERTAAASLSPEQQSLIKLRSALLYPNAEAREQHIAAWTAEQYAKEAVWALSHDTPYATRVGGAAMPLEEHIAEYRQRQEQQPLATDEPYCDWIQLPGSLGRTSCYESHPDCGGYKIFVGPYHYRCSKCSVEVKLWEHGVNYDVG